MLLLEINEILWRLVDRYAGRPEFRKIRRFLEASRQFRAAPWIRASCPLGSPGQTLHPGMKNERHGVKNLGQDPASFRGKTVSEEMREAGGTIGICGPMQRWPPQELCKRILDHRLKIAPPGGCCPHQALGPCDNRTGYGEVGSL
jgi:hypothetical protein